MFQLCWDGSSWVEPEVSKCLGQRHNAVTPMGIDQGAPWYRVKHCRTKPLCTIHENAFGYSSSSVDLKKLAVSNWQNINNYVDKSYTYLSTSAKSCPLLIFPSVTHHSFLIIIGLCVKTNIIVITFLSSLNRTLFPLRTTIQSGN